MAPPTLLLVAWCLCLVQVLTIQPGTPATIPEPFSLEHAFLSAAFLLSSLCLLPGYRRRWLVAVHLALVLLLLLAHPLTRPFGRDGSVAVIAVYLVAALQVLTALRAELKLVVASLGVSLLLGEALLGLAGKRPSRPAGLVDYGDVTGPHHRGGFLRPRLRVQTVGEGAPLPFLTNGRGFRYTREVEGPKPAGVFRILMVGDSFVVGYRTGQDDTLCAVLERTLVGETRGRGVEVLPAGADHPGLARQVVRGNLDLRPDLVIVGITLGNDLAQAWLAHRNRGEGFLADLLLPEDAYQSSLGLVPVRTHRTLRSWRLYRRLCLLWEPDVVFSWFEDHPGRVHVLDPSHALGHFFARRALTFVEESYLDLLEDLEAIAADARAAGSRALFVFFPQRFQISRRDWEATLFEYGLDHAAFDPEAPDRRLLRSCEERGLECTDLLPDFKAAASRPLYLPLGDMHWNRAGHAVAGRALAARLAATAAGSMTGRDPSPR